jgi:hypothetical protein
MRGLIGPSENSAIKNFYNTKEKGDQLGQTQTCHDGARVEISPCIATIQSSLALTQNKLGDLHYHFFSVSRLDTKKNLHCFCLF